MQAKTERFELRLDQSMIDRVDQWRGKQIDLPSRAEAVRRLLELSLSSGSGAQLPSSGEKLILAMLADIYKISKAKGDIEPDFVKNAVSHGQAWALAHRYSGIFRNEPAAEVVEQTGRIFDMWSLIERSYERISPADKKKLATEPFGSNVRFPGFDGHDGRGHLWVAQFYVEEMGYWEEFKGRDLDSHGPPIDSLLRMLDAYRDMMRTRRNNGYLNHQELSRLLKARTHPDFSDK